MPELPAVSPGEVITADHMNDVAARTVQRYTSRAELDIESPTPAVGELAYLEDTAQVLVFSGTVWVVGGLGTDGSLQLTSGVNQLWLIDADGGTDPQSRFNHNNGTMVIQIGDSGGAFAGVLRVARGAVSVEDVDLLTTRDGTQTQIDMTNEASTHHWRFRILGTGQLNLQSAPIGTSTWTTVESWVPA